VMLQVVRMERPARFARFEGYAAHREKHCAELQAKGTGR
jgi:hypothetical protein